MTTLSSSCPIEALAPAICRLIRLSQEDDRGLAAFKELIRVQTAAMALRPRSARGAMMLVLFSLEDIEAMHDHGPAAETPEGRGFDDDFERAKLALRATALALSTDADEVMLEYYMGATLQEDRRAA